MIYLIKSLYAWLLPPGIFIILILLLSIYLLRIKKRAAVMAACIAMLMYVFSTEYLGGLLMRSLESRYYPPQTVSADVIVLLGGGAISDVENVGVKGHLQLGAASRTLTAARLAKLYNLPVLYTGGNTYDNGADEAMIVRKILTDVGIPASSIIIEQQSINTTQSIRNIKGILLQNNFKQPLVVTSAYHMPRSMLICAQNGIEAAAYPTAYQSDQQATFKWHLMRPSVNGMEMTMVAMREYLGILSLYIGYGKL